MDYGYWEDFVKKWQRNNSKNSAIKGWSSPVNILFNSTNPSVSSGNTSNALKFSL